MNIRTSEKPRSTLDPEDEKLLSPQQQATPEDDKKQVKVDEASWESFPTSDPPSHMPGEA